MLLVPSDRKDFDSPASVAEFVSKLPVGLAPAMHMQALPDREVAAVIRTVRASAAVPAARLALNRIGWRDIGFPMIQISIKGRRNHRLVSQAPSTRGDVLCE